jgi:hypothetical protein
MTRNPRSSVIRTPRLLAILAVAMAVVFVAFVTDANAACSSTPSLSSNAAKRLLDWPKLPFATDSSVKSSNDDTADADDIVGLWFVTFKTNDGKLWDKGFQQYHADKTELSVDNAVPPALGNVCVGVWKVVGPRTVKLRHVTWN